MNGSTRLWITLCAFSILITGSFGDLKCYAQSNRVSQHKDSNEDLNEGSFAIRDGDVVGFLGDSITAERTYGKHIEQYTKMRYPNRHVEFLNLGIGGDTAAGAVKRLQRDVFDNHVTLLTVAYGINDIGWGTKADDEHRQAYLDAIGEIVSQCKAHGVRVYICSAAITAEDPDKSEQSYLQKMCDDGLAVAQEAGGNTIQLQRAMREVQRRVISFNKNMPEKDQRSLHVPDGIHLNDLGQLAMAFGILKGLGAERIVSEASLNASSSAVVTQNRCQVSNVKLKSDGGSFERLDESLPYNYGPFAGLNYGFVPISEINQYRIQITGLDAGNYELEADGRGVGFYSAEQLAAGVDISSATSNGWVPGGPWDAQANVIKQLTEARSKLAESDGQRREYFDKPWNQKANQMSAEINERIHQLQHEVARPRPYRFRLTKKNDN